MKELDEERSHSAELDQQIDNLIKRKEELKEQLQASEEELAAVKTSHKYVTWYY